ncbi:Uncharacterised protein [Mycobacteroides abscessus subsp. abscessus]|nr:Uncharacterised protein [Mycobacteroides abscessus subsp. abscessus]
MNSHLLQPLIEKIIDKVKQPLAVAADAAYKTPAIYFHEFKETGYLDLARCLTMILKVYFIGFESKF